MRRRDDAGMITQQIGYSILTAPLAAIDRRALSQAWYSALHLAREARAAVPEEARRRLTPSRGETTRQPRHGVSSPYCNVASTTASGASGTARPAPEACERRAVRSPLARRIERTFLDPARPARRATFTLEGMCDGRRARVHVALRSGESGMHLVAVCSPSLRTGVARALDQARYALAARGIRLTGVVQ